MNEAILQNIEKYLKNLAALTAIVVFLFVIAILVMFASISSCNSNNSSYTHTQECVVPNTDLPEGYVLSSNDLTMRQITFSNYNSEVFYDRTAYLLVGKSLTKSISSGTPISRDHLVAEEKWPPKYEKVKTEQTH